jgi:Txe/YoeB family toxin of Txe-Axe toxin-antitoxin module
MRFLAVFFVFVLFAALPGQTAQGQDLEEAARRERERRAELRSSSRVYTNEDFNKSKPGQEGRAGPQNVLAQPARQEVELAGEYVKLPEQDETVWSRRFSAARARLQEAEDHEKHLKDRLNELSYGCGPETFFDPYYFSYTRQKLEENQKALVAARQGLADLEEALRRSGNPASWERSKLEADTSHAVPQEQPEAKDQDYWREQLKLIDKKYVTLMRSLEAELFEMVHRRPPLPGEDLTITGALGICVPHFVIDIDSRIKGLRENREREKIALMEHALREGALPGWFR